jgi:hypothetical protein
MTHIIGQSKLLNELQKALKRIEALEQQLKGCCGK